MASRSLRDEPSSANMMWSRQVSRYRLSRRYSPPRRWRTAVRLLFLLCAITLCFMTLTSLAPELYIKERRSEYNTPPMTGNPNLKENKVLQDSQPAMMIPEADILPELDPVEKHDLVMDPPPGIREGHSRRITTSHLQTKKDGNVAHIRAGLEYILSIMPDEIHIRELLKPIEGTGKEKLREVGLRTRAYNRYFQAWENLHILAEGGIMYVRDDIIQYLRTNPKALPSSSTFAETVHLYESYRSFSQRLATHLFPWTSPVFPGHMHLHVNFQKGGRGIVSTAGNKQAPYLLVSIKSFRRLGCNLPIEIMYLGDGDLGEDYRAQLEMLPGVITRDLSQMVNDEGWELKGWAAKPFSMLLSSFREVLFVDADALFLQNPEELFEEKAYTETGALFFKDRRIMPESKKEWLQQILPRPISRNAMATRFWTGESGHMQESGVVVIDKWRHFMAMLLVCRMNGSDRDGNKDENKIGVYDMVYGDKETFWIGWELVGDTQYAFYGGATGIIGKIEDRGSKAKDEETPPKDEITLQQDSKNGRRASLEGNEQKPENYTICGPQLLHLDTNGMPLWFNGWLLSNKYADSKKRKPAEFEAYMVEPAIPGEVDAWKLTESNICCLTADRTFPVDDSDRETVKMLIDLAKEVDAVSKR
ncbi:alpha-1,3-mannosyltransferase [Blastomyces gilchristii SLH14081]|uniref:Alpha-1,3-mannosyltransferase n=1 Tax=Blastomyces gilchristii (strain SLH14081) TaxID=559298 RepID=A0A179UUE5_BLAGS|nr:alpha-1,3-mannosyltransferase [Blastomyces gilchristii SLH14081]OAT10778.1 alpha-1,3-mannosyltransferase [Blastomyces gilchristii SLH14081]